MDNFERIFMLLNLRNLSREELKWCDIRKSLLEAHTKDMQSFVQPLIDVTSITYYYLLQVRAKSFNTKFRTYTQHCKKLKPIGALQQDFEADFGIDIEEYELIGLTQIADDLYNIIFGEN